MALDITQPHTQALAAILGKKPITMNVAPNSLGVTQPVNTLGGDILSSILSSGGKGSNVVTLQPSVPTNISDAIIASGQTPAVVVDTRPTTAATPTIGTAKATVDPLAARKEYEDMIAKRNQAARAAVLSRMRQQEQEQAGRPVVTTEGGGRQIAGRYGTGSASPKRTGPAMIEGKPAAQWFQETEARQRRAAKEYADTQKIKEEVRQKRIANA